MKFSILGIGALLLVASCTQSLEQVADTNRQVRMDRHNADMPLTSGASDGMGTYIANKFDQTAPASAPAKGLP